MINLSCNIDLSWGGGGGGEGGEGGEGAGVVIDYVAY